MKPRWTFARKLIAALMAVVAVQLTVLALLVRGQTSRQVENVVARTLGEAGRAFQNLERNRWEEAERFAVLLAGGTRLRAELGVLAGSRSDPELMELVRGRAEYQADLVGVELGSLILTYHDPDGYSLWSWEGPAGRLLTGDDPLSLLPSFDAAWDAESGDTRSYRVVGDNLYRVHTRLEFAAGQPVGGVSVGLRVQERDALNVRDVVGSDLCFVAEGRCLVGTPMADPEELVAAAAAHGEGEADDPIQVRTSPEGERHAYVAQPLEDSEEVSMALAVPLEPVLLPFGRINLALFLGGIASLILAGILSAVLAHSLTRPLRDLTAATEQVARGELEVEVPVTTGDELGMLARSFNAMTGGLRLKEQYRGVLNKVVSPDVAEELMAGAVELGGETRRITVLFGDLRGFTAQTQEMEPQEVIELLNECMADLSAAVDAEGGVVDKFVGDEIMALFGAPVSRGDDAHRALATAIRMQQAIENLNARRARDGQPPLRLGIGISTGEAVVGNMGAPNRLNYTAVGTTVNLGARLCSGAADGEILASPATVEEAARASELDVESLGTRDFKGFAHPLEVFRVNALRRRTGSRGPRPTALLALLLPGLALLGGAPASAQEGAWPTLEEVGYWSSATGRVQFALSGRLDLEGYFPRDSAPGLMRGDEAFFAPRVRLFGDLFIGERFLLTAEGRVDRGHAPAPRDLELRLEQLYLQFGPYGAVTFTAGRFISPFGSWPERHLTEADPFIRPPLPYDHPTVLTKGAIPADDAEFLLWREMGAERRPAGLPPIWDAPYPIGAQMELAPGDLVLKVALLNSAPGSDPAAWNWDGDRMTNPNIALSASWFPRPELRFSAWWNKGPWLLVDAPGGTYDATGYDQRIWGVGGEYRRGGTVVRAEYFRDLWKVPNLTYDPKETMWTAEVQQDLLAGWYVAARYGMLDFSSYQGEEWDDDATRIQVASGFRLARNAGVVGEWLVSGSDGDPAPEEDLLSLRLWWSF